MCLLALAVKEQIVKMSSKQELENKSLVDFYLKLLKGKWVLIRIYYTYL